MLLENNELLIDFAQLAKQHEDFGKIYNAASGHLDFQDAETVQQLTKSILKCDFGLQLELPDDRLCPPVPIRYEYIRWLQNLLDTTSSTHEDEYDPERKAIGIDIGVGASCIYPLLGCISRPEWRFGGTELDQKNFEYAIRNRDGNGLESKIRLHKATSLDPLINLSGLQISRADFVMCNPPFFESLADMQATNITKKRAPSAVCTGAEVEMVAEGGDLGFVIHMLEESKVLRQKVQWYSSMLGKLTSVYALVEKIKEFGLTNWAVATLQAGNVTRRWVVAWSFMDRRPANEVVRKGITAKEILPFPTEFIISLPNDSSSDTARQIDETLGKLNVIWNSSKSNTGMIGICYAAQNVWSRSARRRKEHSSESSTDKDGDSMMQNAVNLNKDEAALGVRISLSSANIELSEVVIIRWLKGYDSVLFESFCGMLKRCLTT